MGKTKPFQRQKLCKFRKYSSLDAAVPLSRIVLPGDRFLNRGTGDLVLLELGPTAQ
jgi:hypothetical protein